MYRRRERREYHYRNDCEWDKFFHAASSEYKKCAAEAAQKNTQLRSVAKHNRYRKQVRENERVFLSEDKNSHLFG